MAPGMQSTKAWTTDARGWPLPRAEERSPIMVATDFSDAASLAVEVAAGLARHLRTDLHVLHVFNDGLWATLKNLYDTQHWSGDDPVLSTRRRLSALTADVAFRHGIRAMAESESGDPAAMIARFAGQCGARMVVIGKAGDDWLTDSILGETALDLLEQAEVPVWIARRPYGAPARILVATDFSGSARRAARLACELFTDGEITLLNAYAVNQENRLRIGGASDEDIDCYRLAEQVSAETAMRQLVFEVDRAKRCRTSVVHGQPVPAILEQAAAEADLIVIGKHGGDAGEQRLGEVAQHVVYHAAGDVLLVP